MKFLIINCYYKQGNINSIYYFENIYIERDEQNSYIHIDRYLNSLSFHISKNILFNDEVSRWSWNSI